MYGTVMRRTQYRCAYKGATDKTNLLLPLSHNIHCQDFVYTSHTPFVDVYLQFVKISDPIYHGGYRYNPKQIRLHLLRWQRYFACSITHYTSQSTSQYTKHIESKMSMKLRDLIRKVRACKTAAEERAVIANESAMIRTAIREEQAHFMHMLGTSLTTGSFFCKEYYVT
jgi:hypothetical protein